MCYNKVRQTVASSEKNEAAIPGLAGDVKLVDMPGHVRLRHAMLASCAPRARGVVFVLDSAALKKNPSDAAEYLYELLAAPALARVPFLVLCNKQDLTWLSIKPVVVVNKLESEFNTIRESRRY